MNQRKQKSTNLGLFLCWKNSPANFYCIRREKQKVMNRLAFLPLPLKRQIIWSLKERLIISTITTVKLEFVQRL